MTKARALRAVGDGGKPMRTRRLSVREAARSGTRRELLVAIRDRIAETVSRHDCPTKDLSPLTRRLQELDRDIAQLDAVDAVPAEPPVDGTFNASLI